MESSDFIKKLQKSSHQIETWYNSLIKEEDSDYILQTSRFKILRLKNIKNPDFKRSDLLTVDLFLDSQIRTVVYIELYPHSEVGVHNHKNNSHFTYINGVYKDHKPNGIVEYKTTHFTFESNPSAYMLYQDDKILWEKNIFHEYDVINNDHSAFNNGDTFVKFLYIDYYV